MKKLALITCACMLAFGASACGSGGNPTKYHSITFDSNGGSDVPGQTVAHGEKIIKPEDPVKNGYSFINWLYRNEAWSFPGYVVTEDMTLIAEWSLNSYNITYALEGGTNNPSNPLTYTIEDEFDLLNPFRSGYTFLGWSINEETITGIKKGTFGDLAIKANWSLSEYTITYNLDGGTNNPSNPSSYNVKSPTIELMQPTKPGYTFLGWTINGTSISSIENGSTGNLNLDANWKAITYHISYNLDGGTNNPSNPLTYTVEDEFALYNPNRTGHTFSGWLINGEQVSIIKKGTIGDLVIDADWSINHYTAVVKSSDQLKGTVTGGGRYEYNSLITITATTQEDCLFIGWFSDDSFSKLISQDPSYSFSIPDNDITLIAYFTTLEESLYEFELNSQSSYTLTKYNSNLTQTIIIPSIFNNLPISSIGTEAFKDCNSITTVVIPDNITSIEQYAFANCSNLVSASIGCGVRSIEQYAFSGCTSLTSIKIPDCVTSIRESAFYKCSNLVSVSIGSGVTSIGSYAFCVCNKLVEVINKSSLNIVAGSSEFGYVAYYAKQVISDETFSKLIIDEDGFIMYLDGDKVHLFGYVGSKTSITIPDGVTSISNYAFSGCTSLTSIAIPDSVTSIGHHAFEKCTSLISIDVPKSVTTIDKCAFSGCTSLTSISLPFVGESQTSTQFLGYLFGASIVADNSKFIPSSLKNVLLNGSSASSIYDSAFYGCSSLTSITILNSVTSIGQYAFSGCTSLTSITIPDSVTSIGQHAFEKCTSLTSITIPNNVTSIEQYAFYCCTSLTSIIIPDSVTSIGQLAFYVCKSLSVVYYYGTQNKWNNMNIRYGNSYLTDASIFYYSETKPTESGNYWHYVNGVPTVW